MDADIRKYIETEHNVFVSENGEHFTRGNRDDTYGWEPIPDAWTWEAETGGFHRLGYGTESEVVEKLTRQLERDIVARNFPSTWVLIRDDDAAETGMSDCWFAVRTEDDGEAQYQYEESGGTVSMIKIIEIG